MVWPQTWRIPRCVLAADFPDFGIRSWQRLIMRVHGMAADLEDTEVGVPARSPFFRDAE